MYNLNDIPAIIEYCEKEVAALTQNMQRRRMAGGTQYANHYMDIGSVVTLRLLLENLYESYYECEPSHE